MLSIISSETFIPSTAADVIPPAYPAPSPQGYIPVTDATPNSFRKILTGDELLVSGAVKVAFESEKPDNLFSKAFMPSFKDSLINSGKILLIFS